MRLSAVIVIVTAGAAIGCAKRASLGSSASSPQDTRPKRCDLQEARFDEGAFLRTDDGVELWYKVAGLPTGRTIAYVHGGPCFGSLDFEKTAGALLERSARMIYFDQRGCGRSTSGTNDANLTLEATVQDLERLRTHLGVDKLDIIAHSAGGWVAVEYSRRYAAHVGHLVLVDTSGAFQESLQYRLDYAAEIAPRAFPEHAERARDLAQRARTAEPMARLQAFGELAALIGIQRWFRTVYFATNREDESVTRWSSELKRHCEWAPGAAWYARAGHLTSDNPALMARLPVDGVLVAGRQSRVFGAVLLEQAAASWRIPLRWIDEAGHFPFAAQPERFTEVVLRSLGE